MNHSHSLLHSQPRRGSSAAGGATISLPAPIHAHLLVSRITPIPSERPQTSVGRLVPLPDAFKSRPRPRPPSSGPAHAASIIVTMACISAARHGPPCAAWPPPAPRFGCCEWAHRVAVGNVVSQGESYGLESVSDQGVPSAQGQVTREESTVVSEVLLWNGRRARPGTALTSCRACRRSGEPQAPCRQTSQCSRSAWWVSSDLRPQGFDWPRRYGSDVRLGDTVWQSTRAGRPRLEF